MQKIHSSKELVQEIDKMNKENSVCHFFIPGKGTFTIILQEEDKNSIASDIDSDPKLKQMILESKAAYSKGEVQTTSELLKSFSLKDFMNEEK